MADLPPRFWAALVAIVLALVGAIVVARRLEMRSIYSAGLPRPRRGRIGG